jgi:hypothetical protein
MSQTYNVGPLNRDQVVEVVSKALNKVFHSRGKKPKGFFRKYLNKWTVDTYHRITMDMAYFGAIPRKDDQDTIHYDNLLFGNVRQTEPISYAMGFRLTKEAIIAMAKRPQGDWSSAQLANMGKVTERLRDSIDHTKEVYALQPFVQGTSAVPSATWVGAGRDGKALFAVDHPILKNPGTAWSNRLPGESLSQSSLFKLIQLAMVQPSPEGLVRNYSTKFKLLVGPKLAGRAYEVVQTRKSIDNNFNNESILNPYNIEVVVNNYFGANYSGYSLICDDHEVGYWEPVDPEFESEKDFDTKGQKFSTFFQFNVDFDTAYDIFHCTG